MTRLSLMIAAALCFAGTDHAGDFFSSFRAPRPAPPRMTVRSSTTGPRWNTVASFRASMGPSTHAQVAALVRANFRTR